VIRRGKGMNPNYRKTCLELLKISKQRGTLDKMKRVYLAYLVREHKKAKAAEATAARERLFQNYS
jgi:hypothetical protein